MVSIQEQVIVARVQYSEKTTKFEKKFGSLFTMADYFDFEVILCLSFKAVFVDDLHFFLISEKYSN